MSLQASSQEQSPSSSQNNPRILELLHSVPPIHENGQYTTVFHTIYNVKSEVDLSQPGIELGAIAALPYLENPTLIDMRSAYGDGLAISWVRKHISLLNAAAGASNRMDEPSLNLCCLDIITSFPFLTLGEFCVFCARMRSLRYVQKRSDYVFSSDTIMQGLREFLPERKQEIDRYEREHKPTVDYSRCTSKADSLNTDEYKQAYEREMQKINEEREQMGIKKMDAEPSGQTEKEIGIQLKPMMSEEEFTKKRDEQIAAMKERYNIKKP